MNTKTLALLASLVVLTTVARAAQTSLETEMVVLPTYTVEAPRYTPAERQVNASLAELRAQAKAALTVPAESPALKTIARAALPAVDLKAVRFAKL